MGEETSDLAELVAHLRDIVQTLAGKYMRKKDGRVLKGRTITLRVKLSDYQRYNRSRSLPKLVSEERDILPVAEDLLRAVAKDEDVLGGEGRLFEVRLLGVAVSNLENEDRPKDVKPITDFFNPAAKKVGGAAELEQDEAEGDDLVFDTEHDGDEDTLLSQMSQNLR